MADLREQALATGTVHQPIDLTTDKTHTVAVLSMPLAGNGSNDASKQALTALRDRLIPDTLGTVKNVSVDVVAPRSLAGTSFCAASTRFCIIRPTPTPSTNMSTDTMNTVV